MCVHALCLYHQVSPAHLDISCATLWWEVICLQDTDGERTGRLTGGRRAHGVEKTASPTITFIQPPADSLFNYTRFSALTVICLLVYSAWVTCGISAVPPLPRSSEQPSVLSSLCSQTVCRLSSTVSDTSSFIQPPFFIGLEMKQNKSAQHSSGQTSDYLQILTLGLWFFLDVYTCGVVSIPKFYFHRKIEFFYETPAPSGSCCSLVQPLLRYKTRSDSVAPHYSWLIRDL